MSKELVALLSICIAISLSMPIGSYVFFTGRHDDRTRVWFTSTVLIGAFLTLVSLRQIIPSYLGHEAAWMLMILGLLLMAETLRRESRAPTNWLIYLFVFCLWALVSHTFYWLGMTQTWGIASYSILMSVICIRIFMMLNRLYQRYPCKSLRLLQVAVMLYTIPSVVRVIAFLKTSSPDVMDVYKFTPTANAVIVAFILAFVFQSFGYWGFTLEKSERERKLAEAGEDLAIQDAERYRLLVQERDHLLVMNSRFSAVSALSSFSAMLVHDISQPLQTLQLGLERLCQRVDHGVSPLEIRSDLKHLEQASDRAGNLVTSLRQLMRSGESQVITVPVSPLFIRINEVLASETLQKKATIEINCELAPGCAILCEPTMLQRIMINLVSNSLNQFELHPVPNQSVKIRLMVEERDGKSGVLISVTDNGGGFPEALLQRLGQPWSSRMPDGMGLALVLTKHLVSQWGGKLELSNRTDGVRGALVQIWLQQVI